MQRYTCQVSLPHIYNYIYHTYMHRKTTHILDTIYCSASALTMKRLGEAETQIIFGESVNEN